MRFADAVVCSAVFFTSAAAQDVPAPPAYRAIHDSIEDAISVGLTPSIAVAVLEQGELVWAQGFGLADRSARRKATADTIYRLASISKPFTATALMRLVDQGLVELDQPVNSYLAKPGVLARRGRAADITLRRLANHTAGLPTHWNFFYGSARPPSRAESIRRYGFALWPPGTRTNYSNLAFGILDHVIARTSGKTFRDYLVLEMFDPLGMSHTDVGVRPKCQDHAAIAYERRGGDLVAIEDYRFDHDGASAVRSSVRDLMRFALIQIEAESGKQRVLSKAAALRMRRRTGSNFGSSFGVGWHISTTKGCQTLGHTGGMPGVSTALKIFPRQQSAVAVLCNFGSRTLVQETMRKVVEIVLADPIHERNAMRGTPGPSMPAPAMQATAPAGDFKGRVAHPDGDRSLQLTVRAKNDIELMIDGVKVGKGTVHRLEVVEANEHRMKLQWQQPEPAPARTLILELDRAAAEEPDGWQGVLYERIAKTSNLPHWVSLLRQED